MAWTTRMNLSIWFYVGSLLSRLKLGRSLSQSLGNGCCIPAMETALLLNQGRGGSGGFGILGGSPPPILAMLYSSESDELLGLLCLGLSGE